MADAQTPEQHAAQLVEAVRGPPGSGWYVELRGPGVAAVRLGPYNPVAARQEAQRLRLFVAAVLRGSGCQG